MPEIHSVIKTPTIAKILISDEGVQHVKSLGIDIIDASKNLIIVSIDDYNTIKELFGDRYFVRVILS